MVGIREKHSVIKEDLSIEIAKCAQKGRLRHRAAPTAMQFFHSQAVSNPYPDGVCAAAYLLGGMRSVGGHYDGGADPFV